MKWLPWILVGVVAVGLGVLWWRLQKKGVSGGAARKETVVLTDPTTGAMRESTMAVTSSTGGAYRVWTLADLPEGA